MFILSVYAFVTFSSHRGPETALTPSGAMQEDGPPAAHKAPLSALMVGKKSLPAVSQEWQITRSDAEGKVPSGVFGSPAQRGSWADVDVAPCSEQRTSRRPPICDGNAALATRLRARFDVTWIGAGGCVLQGKAVIMFCQMAAGKSFAPFMSQNFEPLDKSWLIAEADPLKRTLTSVFNPQGQQQPLT
nr:hypothetical protein [Candidatus Pantoea persica]